MSFNLNVNMERPLQAQLFEQVRAMILDGQLKAGSPLPATRALSEQLGVSRNTVVLAYDRLLAEGYIESKRSIGTFVSDHVPVAGVPISLKDEPPHQLPARNTPLPGREKDKELVEDNPVTAFQRYRSKQMDVDIDFDPAGFDASLFPARSWRRITNKLLAGGGDYINAKTPIEGTSQLRRAIADHLGPARGIIAKAEDIQIVSGVQEARALLVDLLESSFKTLVCETPIALGVVAAFYERGFKPKGIAVEGEGFCSDELPSSGKAVAYVSPNFHFPSGTKTTLAHRARLLEWATKRSAVIIEDDTNAEFSYSGTPLSALKGLDVHDNVIYLGGFRETLGAGLKLAYVILPEQFRVLARQYAAVRGFEASLLDQCVMAEFMESGTFDQHIRKMRKELSLKRDTLVAAIRDRFGEQQISLPDGGSHVVWHTELSSNILRKWTRKANDAGVGVLNVSEAGCRQVGDEQKIQAVRKAESDIILGFGGLERDEIIAGVKRLPDLKKQQQGENG